MALPKRQILDVTIMIARMDARDRRSNDTVTYENFHLEVRVARAGEYSVSVRSPAGEAQEEIRFPFDKQKLDGKLRDLEIAMLRSGDRRLGTTSERTARQFGQELFEALLVDEVRTSYVASREQTQHQNKGLRLMLRIEPPELAWLPWEFLYDPERGEYLCLSARTPVVRYPEVGQPVDLLPITPPLRILGMVINLVDLGPLDVEHEKRVMEEATRDLQVQGRVELVWLRGETWRDLRRAMRRGPWHVFHFIGNCGYDLNRDEPFVSLADETGYVRFLPAEGLARLLSDHFSLRLVLLNSGGGVLGSVRDAVSSTAAALVRSGLLAVVAMQHETTDHAAIEFYRILFESVADGLSLDAAVTEARISVKIELGNTLEWGTPVLYMSTSDGRVFDIGQLEDQVSWGSPMERSSKSGTFSPLPGLSPPPTPTKYGCPACDHVWYRHSARDALPDCPVHGISLQRILPTESPRVWGRPQDLPD